MKRMKACLCGALLGLGCQTPAERVISQFVAEEDCSKRLQYTLYPEADRAVLERLGSGTCKAGSPKVDASHCSNTPVGEACTAMIDSEEACLVRTGEAEFKIDLQCSIGYNEIPVKTYKASPQGPGRATLRLRAEISDYYNYGYSNRKRSHQSLALAARDGENLHGYVARDSKVGERLIQLLSDGKQHKLMLTVDQLDYGSSGHVEVIDLVREDWRTPPPEQSVRDKERASN